jgi:hypothetical protein
MEAAGSQIRFTANEEIIAEREPAEYVYMATKGAVRAYKTCKMAGVRSGASTSKVVSSASKSAKSTRFSAEPIKT